MATRVDIEIVPRAHAILSASSAERWLTCTPSARIEEAIMEQDGDGSSSYASDGTAAHAFAELRLRYRLKQITKDEYAAGYEATKDLYAQAVSEWDTTDWEAITAYTDYVEAEAARLEAKVIIEARVDYSQFAQGGFGTSDALLISQKHKTIKSIDLKFGKGVPVNAANNAQAKLYALGGLMSLHESERRLIEKIEWTIHQPRLDYVGEDEMTAVELLDWANNVVAPAAKLAYEGKGKLVPSDKGCRFCKAAATCRARAAENTLIAMRDFATMPDIKLDDYLMGPDEVAKILPKLDQWMSWANKLQGYALEIARDKEIEIPGYKVVRGRANRAWKPGVELEVELKALGVSETDIFVSPEPAVRSVAQLEKQVGKDKFTPIAEKLVVKPLGTPTLVPVSDPRESVNKVVEAKKAFEA